MSQGPITHNGIHPITGKAAKVIPQGTKGAETHHAPKAAQVAAAGAKTGGAEGKHIAEGKDQKSMASVFYPKAPGLRGAG